MRTILDAVEHHATRDPAGVCVQLVHSGGRSVTSRDGERRTFAEVFEAAGRAARFLAERGVAKGEVVILIGTHHPDLVACWLGCVWVGAVPSILAEPSVRIDRDLYWARLASLCERIGARVLLTQPGIEVGPATQAKHFPYTEAVATAGSAPARFEPAPSDLLLLQHSSGTTGLQKGVMLSHGAVAEQVAAYAEAVGFAPGDSIASWLPLYHDMGLIACFVTPLFLGMKVAWLSPFEWISAPSTLLQAIQRHRSTHVWLPNFAFQFLAGRAREVFDLSSLKAVVNCSEPVSAEAMNAFGAKFASQGLQKGALQACYAMAENVFAVTTSSAMVPPVERKIDRRAWLEQHRATPSDAADALVHVSNGRPIRGTQVKICEPAGPATVPANVPGRVLIKSSCLFSGYYRRPDLDPGLFDDAGFFDTGDVGYLDEGGDLYVTGRMKDLVIVGGRNVYPHDVEAIAAEVRGVHPGRVVAFGVPHRGLSTEGLVVLAESDLEEASWKEVERGLRGIIPSRLDLDLLDARVVPKGSLRKSTSGKLARGGNRDWYLEGRFGKVPPTVASNTEERR